MFYSGVVFSERHDKMQGLPLIRKPLRLLELIMNAVANFVRSRVYDIVFNAMLLGISELREQLLI